MLCDKCGKTVPGDSEFCPYCGSTIELLPEKTELTCEVCGKTLPDDSEFCPYCGRTLVAAAESVVGATPETAAEIGSVKEMTAFLEGLRGPDGETLTWKRCGRLNGEKGVPIDVVETFLPSGDPYRKFYLKIDRSQISFGGVAVTKPAESADPPKKEEKKSKEKRNKEDKPQKKRGKAVLIIVLILILLALLGAAAVVFGLPWLERREADDLLLGGQYDLAYSAYGELGDAEMQKEVRYIQATKYRENGDFELANKLFADLGDYRDSRSRIHEHKYQMVSYTKGTCIAEGEEQYKCEGCTASYITRLSFGDHEYALTEAVAVTCEENGGETYVCKFCGDSYSEVFEALGHNMELLSAEGVSCTTGGTEHYACANCGLTEDIEVKASGHTLEIVSKIEATCQKTGSVKYRCSVCGENTTTVLPIAAHRYTTPTCTEASRCKVCNLVSGKPLSHSDTVFCTMCDKKVFQTLEWSGKGDKGIVNIVLPKGHYTITVTYTDGIHFEVILGDGFGKTTTICNVFGPVSYVYTDYSSKGTKNAYLDIESWGSWTVTIEGKYN